MRRWIPLPLAIAIACPGLGLGISTGVSLGWGPVDPVDINLAIGALNGALEYYGTLGVGDVPPLRKLDQAIGLRVSQGLDLGIRFGLELAIFKTETSTEGTFQVEGDTHRISASIALRYARFGPWIYFPLFDGFLGFGISGGMAIPELRYAVSFPVPEDWDLSFVPLSDVFEARALGIYGTAFMRADMIRVPGFSLVLEIGWHLQPVAVWEGGTLDLNGDGKADGIGLVGFWLGGGIRISF